MRYVESLVQARGDVAVYVDLRTVGSPEGLFIGETVHATERSARLLVDIMGQVHESLLTAAIYDERLIVDADFVSRLDDLLTAITTIRVRGDVEVEEENERKGSSKRGGTLAATAGVNPTIRASSSGEVAEEDRQARRQVRGARNG